MEKEIKVYINGQTNYGAYVQGVSVTLPEDYTMTQAVKAIGALGYVSFILIESNMKHVASVPEWARVSV